MWSPEQWLTKASVQGMLMNSRVQKELPPQASCSHIELYTSQGILRKHLCFHGLIRILPSDLSVCDMPCSCCGI